MLYDHSSSSSPLYYKFPTAKSEKCSNSSFREKCIKKTNFVPTNNRSFNNQKKISIKKYSQEVQCSCELNKIFIEFYSNF